MPGHISSLPRSHTMSQRFDGLARNRKGCMCTDCKSWVAPWAEVFRSTALRDVVITTITGHLADSANLAAEIFNLVNSGRLWCTFFGLSHQFLAFWARCGQILCHALTLQNSSCSHTSVSELWSLCKGKPRINSSDFQALQQFYVSCLPFF